MSIEALNWALETKAGGSAAKSVLLILANRANHNGRCYPGIDGIAEQTELSKRTVIRSIQKLVDEGVICAVRRGGDGTGRKSNTYQLHIDGAKCQFCTLGKVPDCHIGQGANVTGQSDTVSKQSDAVTPEPKDNPKGKPKGSTRAHRIPDDFDLTPERREVAERERVDPDREFAKFTDHWRAESGAKARKRDWDAAWRNWCRMAVDRFGGRSGGRKAATDPYYDELRRGLRGG